MTWPTVKLGEVLRLQRRWIKPSPTEMYQEIGIRSYGKGIFHKQPINGLSLGNKRVLQIEPGDLVFNNVFAWEGAVAVATEREAGMIGSHRFVTYTVNPDLGVAPYLHLYFAHPLGRELLIKASPGSAGRNKTLGLERFISQSIPLPPLAEQRRLVARIDALAAKIDEAKRLRAEADEAAGVLPNRFLSVLVEDLVARYDSIHLGELLINADYGTSTKCLPDREKGTTPVLRIPNVALEHVTLKDIKYGSLSKKDLEKCLLVPGDILIVRTNGSLNLVGRSAVVPELLEPTAFASYMIRIRCNEQRIESAFLQLMMRHLRASGQIVDFARTTAGQYNVSLGRLRKAIIPLPGLDAQRKIVERMIHFQNVISPLAYEQDGIQKELNAMLPAILDRAFRGEL